jgi:hypothetical protein
MRFFLIASLVWIMYFSRILELFLKIQAVSLPLQLLACAPGVDKAFSASIRTIDFNERITGYLIVLVGTSVAMNQ